MAQSEERSLVSLAWLLGGITFISIVILGSLTIGVYGVSRALSVRPTPSVGDRIAFLDAYRNRADAAAERAFLMDYGRERRPTLVLNTTSAGVNCSEWIAYAQYLADQAATAGRPYFTDGKLDRGAIPDAVFANVQALAAAAIEMTDRYDECLVTSGAP
jgi:hypothetical protein